MVILVQATSRFVVLLVALSVILVAGRFLHDRYRSKGQVLARLLFGATVAVGLAALTPFVLASGALIAGTVASYRSDWRSADHYYWLHEQFGGGKSETALGFWAAALMNSGHFTEARQLLLGPAHQGGRQAVSAKRLVLVGICDYYLGAFGEAERSFRALPAGGAGFLPEYFLGRVAQRRGAAGEALRRYRGSFAQQANFYPTFYQLVRLESALGERGAARASVDRFIAAGGGPATPEIAAWRVALEGPGLQLPEKEFAVIVR
jgi:hypothetical protein